MGLDPRVYPRAGLTALSSIVCIFAFFLPLAFVSLTYFPIIVTTMPKYTPPNQTGNIHQNRVQELDPKFRDCGGSDRVLE